MTLGLIVVHAGLLLFDTYLRPGLAGITLPFAMSYRPAFTGLGIIGGWLAAILGLSFYARRRIGTKTWRMMHRFTIVVYLLALVHVIGAGTNGTSPWMIGMLTALTAPIVFTFTYRMLPGSSRRARRALAAQPSNEPRHPRHRVIADAVAMTPRGSRRDAGRGPGVEVATPAALPGHKAAIDHRNTRLSSSRVAGGEDLRA